MKHRPYILDLTHRLQRGLDHDIYFALALAEYATPEDLRCLETILELSQRLRNEELGEEQRVVRERLKEIDRTRTGLSKKGIRRTFKVRRVVEV